MEVKGFPHQVGGHFGLLTCAGHVLKPWNAREFAFYSQMDKSILPFIAKVCVLGHVKVNLSCQENHRALTMTTDSTVTCHKTEGTSNQDNRSKQTMTFRIKDGRVEAEKPILNLWAGQCQSKVVQKLVRGEDRVFMMFEDLVTRYDKPCVIDLKMGTRQHGDDASAQKRLNQTQKCRLSTSEEYGVRMVGMQLYHAELETYSYINKYEGRRMTHEEFKRSLGRFFCTAGETRTNYLVAKLKELKSILARAEGFRFFSSSLLIAFDGNRTDNTEELSLNCIDFAHSTFNGFMDDRRYTGTDEGYLLGIESLLTFLQEELKHGPVLDFKPIGGKLKRKQSANEILEGCGSKEYELFLHQNEAKKFKLKRKFSTESSSQHISK